MTDPKHAQTRLQEMAWIGDAVLALWARQWLLEQDGEIRPGRFTRLTCNQFLACFGNPTVVEARFGEVYMSGGLAEAFRVIEQELVPLFTKQEAKLARQSRGRTV